jgi:hypothetical protein
MHQKPGLELNPGLRKAEPIHSLARNEGSGAARPHAKLKFCFDVVCALAFIYDSPVSVMHSSDPMQWRPANLPAALPEGPCQKSREVPKAN